MTQNIGQSDKILRIVAGLAVLSLVFVLQGPVRWVGLIGIVPLLTAAFGVCPAYSIFHVSTCKRTE